MDCSLCRWVDPDPREALLGLALRLLCADVVAQLNREEPALFAPCAVVGGDSKRQIQQFQVQVTVEDHATLVRHRGNTRTNGTMTSSILSPPWLTLRPPLWYPLLPEAKSGILPGGRPGGFHARPSALAFSRRIAFS